MWDFPFQADNVTRSPDTDSSLFSIFPRLADCGTVLAPRSRVFWLIYGCLKCPG
ncbi:hypothetical protein E2C01_069746 [Portunus trituberculatus]|uniref:Uncharacterized protein n=1 Tax=Portunus trituberculatus TaxID=210409 RepID=A0A5B7HQV4_PORTR|nr:hypothetical protein [Portunus trituberculatus]